MLYDKVNGNLESILVIVTLAGKLQTSLTLTSEALVFLVVPLRDSTKFISGYFLVDKVNACAQSELVKTALQRTANHGINI